MKRVLSTLISTAAIVSLSAGTALACTFSLSGTGNCATNGSYNIVWAVNNTEYDEPLDLTSSSNPSVISSTAVIPADKIVDFSQTVSGTQPSSYNLTLTGHFPSYQPNITETATVTLAKACTQPAPATYSCDLLNVTPGDNRTVTISKFNTSSANGASFKDAEINWGDNTPTVTTATVTGQSHQYAQAGTYTVTANAHFTVNGNDVDSGVENCTAQVTFTTPPPVTPPVTPTPPTTPPVTTPPAQLVNTGPGSVISVFAVAAVIGTFAYRFVLRRKLS